MLLVATALSSPALAGGSAGESESVDEPVANVREVSLEECRQLALKCSASVLLATSSVKDAELALAQAEATSLTRPSPTSVYQARVSLEVAKKNLDIAKQDAVLSADQQYYSLLKAEHLVSISEQALDLAEKQLEIAKAKERVGMATKLDLIRAENQVASAQNSVASATLNRDLAMVALNQAIGFAPETVLRLRDEFSHEETGDLGLEASIAFALEHRVEIAQAQSSVEAADMNVTLSDNDFTPRLTYERAKLAAEDARVRLEEQKNKISMTVRQAYVALKQAEAKVQLTAKKVAEAEENLRVTQLLFEADMATNLDVLTAQNQYTQSRIDALQAVYDYNVARSQFKRAIGDTSIENGGTAS
jgi:outer membrane protein TolC